jgi:hypothetical protein
VKTRLFRPIGAWRAVVLAVGLVLLIGAWEAATMPFDAPDEASHYVRAISLTNGVVLGPKVVYGPYPKSLSPTQQAWANLDTRAVRVPATMLPGDIGCIDRRPDVGSCLVADPNGNFPPLGYALPAAALGVSHNVTVGLWLSRTASALQSAAFLVLAVWLLWEGSTWSLLGLLAAVTPMVLFVSSILNTSGIEIAACLAFGASVLRITRDPEAAGVAVWAAFAASGVVGMLTGPIGIAFVAGWLVVMAVLAGRQRLRRLLSLRRFQVSMIALVAAAVVTEIYTKIAGFSGQIGFTPIRSSLRGGLSQLGPVLQDAVGHFGALTVLPPRPVLWVWWLLVVALIIGAMAVGGRRVRIGMPILVVLALAFPVLFWAWIDRYSGFGLQGREVLPALLIIPLVAGELISRRQVVFTSHRSAHLLLGAVVALIAVLQAYAWWYSARAAAGPHRLRFYLHSTYVPPGGWWPWIAGAAAGTVALLAFAASAAAWPRSSDRRQAAAPAARTRALVEDGSISD